MSIKASSTPNFLRMCSTYGTNAGPGTFVQSGVNATASRVRRKGAVGTAQRRLRSPRGRPSLRTCFAMKSRNVSLVRPSLRMGRSDLACSSPIPVPSPPLSFNTTVFSSNWGSSISKKSYTGRESTGSISLSPMKSDLPEVSCSKLYSNARIAVVLRPLATILASNAAQLGCFPLLPPRTLKPAANGRSQQRTKASSIGGLPTCSMESYERLMSDDSCAETDGFGRPSRMAVSRRRSTADNYPNIPIVQCGGEDTYSPKHNGFSIEATGSHSLPLRWVLLTPL
eukprot:scaffold1650_cov124-Isochrysis_galbana.AAC.1